MAPPGIREVTRDLPVPPTAAWAVLSDPRTYPRWLVGAVDILGVDAEWPAVGSSFEHEVGVGGPLTTKDTTSVEELDDGRFLQLDARARPFGRAHVEIEVRAREGGCQVAIHEGVKPPMTPITPLVQPLIMARNKESLRRLADLPELGG